MQKGDQKKLSLLLTGIRARLEQNKDYFGVVKCTFVAGKKNFPANISLSDGNYILKFQGVSNTVSPNEITNFFAKQAEQYEQSELVYEERGAVITITCNAKGVNMKQSEPKIHLIKPLTTRFYQTIESIVYELIKQTSF